MSKIKFWFGRDNGHKHSNNSNRRDGSVRRGIWSLWIPAWNIDHWSPFWRIQRALLSYHPHCEGFYRIWHSGHADGFQVFWPQNWIWYTGLTINGGGHYYRQYIKNEWMNPNWPWQWWQNSFYIYFLRFKRLLLAHLLISIHF